LPKVCHSEAQGLKTTTSLIFTICFRFFKTNTRIA